VYLQTAITDADTSLISTLTAVGGEKYGQLASLIFRQAFGACDAVWNEKAAKMWYFLKEISSCGCLQTVDVIFPMYETI
jgi:hypothetical protein